MLTSDTCRSNQEEDLVPPTSPGERLDWTQANSELVTAVRDVINRDLERSGLGQREKESLQAYVRDLTAPHLAGPTPGRRGQQESAGKQPGRSSFSTVGEGIRSIGRMLKGRRAEQQPEDTSVSGVLREAVLQESGEETAKRDRTERDQVITVAAAHLVNDILNSNTTLQKALADDRNESQALLRAGGLMPPLTSSRLNGAGVGAALDGPSPHEPLPYGELVERGVRSESGVHAGAGLNTGSDMPQSVNGAFEIFRSDYSEQDRSVSRSVPDAPQSGVQRVGGPGPHVPPFHNDEAPPVPPKVPHGSSADGPSSATPASGLPTESPREARARAAALRVEEAKSEPVPPLPHAYRRDSKAPALAPALPPRPASPQGSQAGGQGRGR
ncbi:hypothetical protein [Streptomyces sp. 7N604]|uniref:hypothetical protein n=1 Tax=Streptomyces sp. 7N604 TaxID=3457415 RepID=UPI003FD1DFAD